MKPLQNCNGPTIRIGREILCLPYAGFFTHERVLTAILDSQKGCVHQRNLYFKTYAVPLKNLAIYLGIKT